MELKLYEIAPEFLALMEKDELTEEDEQQLDSLTHAIEVKASNIAAITDNMEAFVEMCRAEEKRIAGKRKAVENRIEWVNRYLQSAMEATGIMQIEIGTRKISLQDGPHRLVIDDESAIPPRFIDFVPESYQVNKNAVKEALKEGATVPGCHLEQGLFLRKR